MAEGFVHVTLFEKLGAHGARVEHQGFVEWTEEGVREALIATEVQEKNDQQLFCFARYEEGSRRGNEGLLANSAACFDVDCADVGTIDRLRKHFISRGFAFLLYTSWSHLKADKVHADTGLCGPFECFRVAIPYVSEVSPEKHAAIVQGMFGHEIPLDPPKYLDEVHGKYIVFPNGRERAAKPRGIDPVSARPSQAFFMPTPWAHLELHQGAFLDTEAVLLRPTSPRPLRRRERTYVAPCVEAERALQQLNERLAYQGFGFLSKSGTGWWRSVCPSCQDPSPSLTARANGDVIDLHCHAHCSRTEILSALGLQSLSAFQEESDLRERIVDQLTLQLPTSPAVSVNVASAWLVEEIRKAAKSQRPTIIRCAAGVGKTFASAKVISELAKEGEKVVYCTQMHVVAAEAQSKLSPGVASVHLRSPLIALEGGAVCARAEELREMVFEHGARLAGSICPKCPQRDGCAAHAEMKDRTQNKEKVNVLFCSHAGIRQAVTEQQDFKLIVDEMPSAFEEVAVSGEDLETLAGGVILPSAHPHSTAVACSIAFSWVSRQPPRAVNLGQGGMRDPYELALALGRLHLQDGVSPSPLERKLLKAADAVVRLAAWHQEGGRLVGTTNPTQGVSAMLPDACHRALVEHKGVLLSATPMLQALPGFDVRDQEVTDGAPVKRVMVARERRGSWALTRSYLDADGATRPKHEGEGLGVPWDVVAEALQRATEAAEKYDPPRVLFVSFKPLIEALRPLLADHPNICLAHYGALRGRNDWMEGKPEECSVVYCLGAPRGDMLPTFYQLGCIGDAAHQAWSSYAAGELAQAEGRLRMPRRTKPCTIFVEGDVAPSTWHMNNITMIDEEQKKI